MPPVSEFYARRRRFAHGFAVACAVLLVAQIQLGLHTERYAQPQIAPGASGGANLVHLIVSEPETGPTTRLLELDSAFQLRQSISPGGEAGGVLVEETGISWFFGSRVSVQKEGNTIRGEDLKQAWEVHAVVLDPGRGTAWIFGWSDGKILARRRGPEGWSPEMELARSKTPSRLVAAMDGARGPLVAWRESGPARVQTLLFDGSRFVPRSDFDAGGADLWDVVPVRDRILFISYRREDRSFRAVTLRLRCCPECGQPPPPEQIAFREPPVLLGRAVTGLAACASGDRLLLALTRETLVQAGGIPSTSFLPEPGARLLPIAAEPLWRRLAAAEFPLVTIFGAITLLCLGISMFRERSRVLSSAAAPPPPRVYADLLEHAMAQILDVLIVTPQVFLLSYELMSTIWEQGDFLDPGFFKVIGVVTLTKVAYHAIMESTVGWTFGKKILGLKVVRTDGSRAGLKGGLLRSVLRLVEVEFAFGLLGALVIANSPRRQRLGDVLGGTVVLEDRPPPPARPRVL